MSYIEFKPKCLPSDVFVVISKQLAFPLRDCRTGISSGNPVLKHVNAVSFTVIYVVWSVHKII